MATDNVVPIDAEAARHLAQRNKRFKGFVAALGAIWLAAVVGALLFTPLPPLAPLLALGTLVVLAEHRSVLFGDETALSASMVIMLGAVLVFRDSGLLVGSLAVGSVGGLYLPSIRRRDFLVVASNTFSFGLTTLIAGIMLLAISQTWTSLRLPTLLVAIACTFVYWVANSFLVGVASSLRDDTLLWSTTQCHLRSDWPMLTLGAAGFILASTTQRVEQLVLLLAVPLLAFELSNTTRRYSNGVGILRQPSRNQLVITSSVISITLLGQSSLILSVAIIGIFLAISPDPRPRSRATELLCTGIVLWVYLAIGMGMRVPTLLLVSGVAVAAWTTSQVIFLGRCCWSHSTVIDRISALGVAIPGRRDLYLIGGITCALLVLNAASRVSSVLASLVALAIFFLAPSWAIFQEGSNARAFLKPRMRC